MQTFNLEEYRKNKNNAKINIFSEYLYQKFEILDKNIAFDNNIFSLLNTSDLIESLEYYIAENHVTAQVTADNYISYIRELFDVLSKNYNIKNDVFFNKDLNDDFTLKTKEIISKLRKTENKDCADDDQYERLNIGIEKFLTTYNEQMIFEEIKKFKDDSNKTTMKNYNPFVSILPTKLVMKFGLKNITVSNIELQQINLETKHLYIKNFVLPLDNELLDLFSKYLRVREYVIKLYNSSETKLFIKHNAEPFVKSIPGRKDKPDYAGLFKIMENVIGNRSATSFAKRKILEMLNNGISISTISELTDLSNKGCIDLQDKNFKDDDVNQILNTFFNPQTKNDISKKEYIKCPICGKEVRATSDNLVLAQFLDKNDETKYLACKTCRGNNGKYSNSI
jgi:hypothetical protein